jgi:hypothetical protein
LEIAVGNAQGNARWITSVAVGRASWLIPLKAVRSLISVRPPTGSMPLPEGGVGFRFFSRFLSLYHAIRKPKINPLPDFSRTWRQQPSY